MKRMPVTNVSNVKLKLGRQSMRQLYIKQKVFSLSGKFTVRSAGKGYILRRGKF